ncbi:hypothetical protein PIB30_007181 [Stylosanthes scabra]|uniref:CRAL-TRIO domain-containing protein n=1 Tax=Stylosanthes scabra TaxID=79078 RepID=A0ABU6U3B9_9FABA|nr:hypothetical protein [Stylosanthes scabra]
MFLLRKKSQNQLKNDSSSQDAKVGELKAGIGGMVLSERSLKYCTDGCLRRYLEARNWDLDKSKKMLLDSLNWRSSFKPEEIRWSDVAHVSETGKVFRANLHDRLGRTVLIMRPGMHQNIASPEDDLRHLVYLLENAILNLPEGQEQMTWLLDFDGFSLSTNIPIKTSRDIIYVLQNHYPERLGVVILYNPPRIFEVFFKAVRYFIDPKTTQKLKFVYPNNKDSVEFMNSLFDVENLPSEFGGKATMKYDHDEFSRLMVEEDVKTAQFWGLDHKPHHTNNGQSCGEVAS